MLYRLFRTKRVTGSFRGHFRDPWSNRRDRAEIARRHLAGSLGLAHHPHPTFLIISPDPHRNIFDLLLYGLMMVSVMLRLFYYLSDARTGAEIYRRDRHLVPGDCRRDLCHACARESTERTCMRAGFNPFDPNYQEMGDIAEAYTSVFTADAAAVLIIAFKTLKYFKLQRDLSMMRDTLAQARCGRDATEMRRQCDGDTTEMRRRCDRDATEMRRRCDRDATKIDFGYPKSILGTQN